MKTDDRKRGLFTCSNYYDIRNLDSMGISHTWWIWDFSREDARTIEWKFSPIKFLRENRKKNRTLVKILPVTSIIGRSIKDKKCGMYTFLSLKDIA